MAEDKPQGNQAPPGQGDGGEPKFVTEEQLNRAISARLGDFQKKFEKTIEGAIGGLGAKLDEITKREPSGGTPPPGGGDGSKSIEDSPIVRGLQKQLADTKALAEATKAERDAEKQKTREQSLRTKVQDALTTGGIDPKFVRHAVGYLVDAEKRVRFEEESDELVFRDGTTDVDFGTGLKTWLKSDEAKIYMTPRGTKGSGDTRDGRQSSNGQQPAPMTAGRALLGMALGTVAGGNTNE
jgi:hypothetical protein